MKKPTRTAPNKASHVRVAKDLRREVRDLRRAGWVLTVGGRHPMLTCPAGHHALPVPQDGGPVIAAFRTNVRRHDETCSRP